MAEPFKMIRARQPGLMLSAMTVAELGKLASGKCAGICEKLLSVMVMPCKVKALVASGGRKWTVPF